jgi:hypothetical protein
LFALFTNLAWRRKRPRYPAHLYVALHLHAAWFGALAVARVATAALASDAADTIVGLAAFGYIAWYGLVCARAVYGDSWVATSAKVAAIAVVYGVCQFAGSLGVMAYAIAAT